MKSGVFAVDSLEITDAGGQETNSDVNWDRWDVTVHWVQTPKREESQGAIKPHLDVSLIRDRSDRSNMFPCKMLLCALALTLLAVTVQSWSDGSEYFY